MKESKPGCFEINTSKKIVGDLHTIIYWCEHCLKYISCKNNNWYND